MGDFALTNSINFFALLLLMVLLVHTTVYFKMHHANDKNIWRNVLVFAILAQSVDMLGYFFENVSGDISHILLHVFRAGLFVMVTMLAANMSLFFEYSIGSRTENYFKLKRTFGAIVIISLIVQVVAIPFDAIISISSSNEYLRGDYYTVGVLLMALPAFIIMYRLVFIHLKKLNQLIKNNAKIVLLVLLLMISLSSITIIEGVSEHNLEVTFPVIALVLTSMHLMLMSASTSIDHLTGMQNVLGMDRYFEDLPKISTDYVVALFFDLDKFKQVNDTYGHKMGDVILQDFSRILMREVRNKDLAARIGGDEFLLVIQADHKKAIDRFIEVIKEKVDEYNKKHEIKIYYSCGISINEPNTLLNRQTLVESADKKMYKAKEIEGTASYI